MKQQTTIEEQKALNIKLTASIIFNQLALFYNEELKHTPYYCQEIKKGINMLIPHLIKKEALEYDKIFAKDSQLSENLSSTVIELIRLLTKKDFVDVILITNIIRAFEKDQKSVMGIVKKVLTHNTP